MKSSKSHTTIDAYIAEFPTAIQTVLKAVRNTIQQAAPEAKEAIKYAMPTFILHKNLVHFAVNKHHIGLYPGPSGVSAFEEKLISYKTSKGAIQFPLDKPMPLQLISEIVKFRVKEQNLKYKEKSSKK